MNTLVVDEVQEIRITDVTGDYQDVCTRWITIIGKEGKIRIKLDGWRDNLKIEVETSRKEKV